jgi:hypothetical protein
VNTGVVAAWTGRVIGPMVGVVLALGVLGTANGAAADREDLEIVVTPREPRPDVFVLKGRVKPNYKKQEAILQRRNCGDCSWYAFEKFQTDGESRFKLAVPTPRPEERRKVCYRVKIPRSDQYRRAISISNCIGGL